MRAPTQPFLPLMRASYWLPLPALLLPILIAVAHIAVFRIRWHWRRCRCCRCGRCHCRRCCRCGRCHCRRCCRCGRNNPGVPPWRIQICSCHCTKSHCKHTGKHNNQSACVQLCGAQAGRCAAVHTWIQMRVRVSCGTMRRLAQVLVHLHLGAQPDRVRPRPAVHLLVLSDSSALSQLHLIQLCPEVVLWMQVPVGAERAGCTGQRLTARLCAPAPATCPAASCVPGHAPRPHLLWFW